MNWTVNITKKVEKQRKKLPKTVDDALIFLIKEIEVDGPVRGNWSNYGKLGRTTHHCHLKKGNPTYVAIWEVTNKKIKLVEVTYAGTHEKAPY